MTGKFPERLVVEKSKKLAVLYPEKLQKKLTNKDILRFKDRKWHHDRGEKLLLAPL
jgi:hypothetical protein